MSGAAEVRRARAAVLVAEIIARWPALLPDLFGWADGDVGLRGLFDAAGEDDVTWIRVAARTGLDHVREKSACTALRDLLRPDDGRHAVALVERLL